MPHVELPQAEFKVVMLGDTNTGKTSLVLRFAEGYYRGDSAHSSSAVSNNSNTVGAFFITKRLQVQGITCKIQIWDTAGQEQFRRMAPMYYKNAAAAICCFDVTSQHSYQVMKEWVDELHCNVEAGSIVICIAACKTDLLTQQAGRRQGGTAASADKTMIDLTEAQRLASSMGAMFVDTSAKTNTNVIGLFRKVAERVLQFKQNTAIPVTPGASIDANGNVYKKTIPPTTTTTTALSSSSATTTVVNRYGLVSSTNAAASSSSSPTTAIGTTAARSLSPSAAGGAIQGSSYRTGTANNNHNNGSAPALQMLTPPKVRRDKRAKQNQVMGATGDGVERAPLSSSGTNPLAMNHGVIEESKSGASTSSSNNGNSSSSAAGAMCMGDAPYLCGATSQARDELSASCIVS